MQQSVATACSPTSSYPASHTNHSKRKRTLIILHSLILQSSYFKPSDSQKSLRRTFSFHWWEECLHLSLFTVPVFQNLTGFSFCTRNVHTLSEIMLNHCFCPGLYLSGYMQIVFGGQTICVCAMFNYPKQRCWIMLR